HNPQEWVEQFTEQQYLTSPNLDQLRSLESWVYLALSGIPNRQKSSDDVCFAARSDRPPRCFFCRSSLLSAPSLGRLARIPPGKPQLLLRYFAIRIPFCRRQGPPAVPAGEVVLYPTTAEAGKQPQFPLARLALKELEHRGRVGAVQPLLLGHGIDSGR